MKVFFTASQRGKEKFGGYYNLIVGEIKKRGFQVLEDDISDVTPTKLYEQLGDGGHKVNVEFYKKKLEKIQEADVNVFEVSAHSLSIGFIIEKSLEANKPTIVLYCKDYVPYFLTGSQDEKLILKNYDDKNIRKVLDESLSIAKERRDKRFNFFISPKLLDYLEKTSKSLGITKSKFIRNLLLDHMKAAA